MAGGQCVPAYHTFPCKKREFQTFILSFSLQWNSMKLRLFAKFGKANLFMDPSFRPI